MEISRRKFISLSLAAGGIAVDSFGLPVSSARTAARPIEVKVVKSGGLLKIAINGKQFDPLSFRTFRPEERNIGEFHEAGVQLMSVLTTGLNCSLDVPYSYFGETWTGPDTYDFGPLDKQMELFIKKAPNTFFNIKYQLDTRQWWLDRHPEAGDGTYKNLVELAAYEPWRKDAAAYQKALIDHVEAKYGDIVYAYTPFCGYSTEWYMYRYNLGLPKEKTLRLAPFRKFTGDQRTQLPSLEQLSKTSNGVFRDPVKDKASVDYWRFHNEVIADTILYMAREAKKAMNGKKLIGLYYGYLVELVNARLLQEGHMGYEKVLTSPDIDMIYDIASYGNPRTFEGASGFLGTIDSIALKGKLCFHECDHTTHIAPTKVENGRAIPGSTSKLKNENESVMVLRREFAMTRAKGVGLWWFDFFGGYYYDPLLMKEVKNMVAIQKRLTGVQMKSVAEIAVFGDVQSMYYVSQHAKINNDCLQRERDELNRIGAPYDIFDFGFFEDANIPHEQYRLYIFLNAFRISKKQRKLIDKKVKTAGKTALWLYAPDYIQKEGFSIESVSRCVGIQLAALEGEEQLINVKDETYFQGRSVADSYESSLPVSPVFGVSDEKATVLGHYAKSGKPALAFRKTGNYTAFYSGLGGVPASILRQIAKTAGVHIYYEGNDPVYINNRLIGIHFQQDTLHNINLPFNTYCRLEELFDGGGVKGEKGKCVLPSAPGKTKLYLLTDAENKPEKG